MGRTVDGMVGDRPSGNEGSGSNAPVGEQQAPATGLPAGVITFVMTDIEGSTRLFRELGDRYVEVLATHQALLRGTFTNHRGVEVGAEGDALFFVFADASEAVAACLEGQRALAAQPWPPGVELRVRIGMHTGEARPVRNDYVDLAVHQAARISAGAHGGQVLLSQATAAAVEGRMPDGATLVFLGSFQLRGFPEPERLFQLGHPGTAQLTGWRRSSRPTPDPLPEWPATLPSPTTVNEPWHGPSISSAGSTRSSGMPECSTTARASLDTPIEALDHAFDELFALNVKACLLGVKAAVPALMESSGSVLLTASHVIDPRGCGRRCLHGVEARRGGVGPPDGVRAGAPGASQRGGAGLHAHGYPRPPVARPRRANPLVDAGSGAARQRRGTAAFSPEPGGLHRSLCAAGLEGQCRRHYRPRGCL